MPEETRTSSRHGRTPTRSAPSAARLLGLAALLAVTSATPAQPEPTTTPTIFILLDRDLKTQPVQVQSITGGALRFTDATRTERERPLGELLALTQAPADAQPPRPRVPLIPSARERIAPARSTDKPGASDRKPALAGVVELIDGQRFPGELSAEAGASAAATADTLAWLHPRFGSLRIPLEQIARVDLSGLLDAPRPAAPRADDEVIFRNGDAVRGLVESVGATVVVSTGSGGKAGGGKAGGGGATSTTPIERVREIRLANKPRPPAPGSTYVWLADGTVARLERIETATEGPEPGVLSGSLTGGLGAAGRGLWRIDEMTALAFSAGSLRPLSSLPIRKQEAGPGRRRFEPAAAVGSPFAPLWLRDIQVRGPQTIEWELPVGSTAIIGSLDMPEEAWTWGDCDAALWLVRAGNPAQLVQERLHAARPHAELNLTLSGIAAGDVLRLTVDAGANSGIQDWADLRQVFVVGK